MKNVDIYYNINIIKILRCLRASIRNNSISIAPFIYDNLNS